MGLPPLNADDNEAPMQQGDTILAILGAQQELSTFVENLLAFDLTEFTETARTIFVPTNNAFAAFAQEDPDVFQQYFSSTKDERYRRHAKEILLHHFASESDYGLEEIFGSSQIPTESIYVGNITIFNETLDGVVGRDDILRTEINSTPDGDERPLVLFHILERLIIPIPLQNSISKGLIDDMAGVFSFSTMANLAMFVGLEDELDALDGRTLMVPPNRRFNRAEIDVAGLLTPEMREYTLHFVRAHLIDNIYFTDDFLLLLEEVAAGELMLTSMLGTSIWIFKNTDDEQLRLQSVDILVPDQIARNG